jgi:prepilin-type processing-associated H-X9-DG protein
LDRAPEVKTLRRKLAKLASVGRAAQFGDALARRRVELRGKAMGFLYVDGHVRVYHGQHALPKAHVARMRISLPATSDYWVNDVPAIHVVVTAGQCWFSQMPSILVQVRGMVSKRRVTVVFGAAASVRNSFNGSWRPGSIC